MPGLDPDSRRLLELLDSRGVVLLAATESRVPDGSAKLQPGRWRGFTAQGNADRLARWRPGSPLCAVLGHDSFAAVDVDTKNGATLEAAAGYLDRLSVTPWCRIRTPSGGAHLYVAGNPAGANYPADDGGHAPTGIPGVEVFGDTHLLFLPGSGRAKYPGAGYTIEALDSDRLEDDSSALWADLAARKAAHTATRPSTPATPASPAVAHLASPGPTRRSQAYNAQVLADEIDKLAATPKGGRNEALHTAAVKLGSGTTYSLEEVTGPLLDACQRNGLLADGGRYECVATIGSGFNFGRANPRDTAATNPAGHPDTAAGPALALVDPVTGEIRTGATPEVAVIGEAAAGSAESSRESEARHGPRLWKAAELDPAAAGSWLALGRIPRAGVSLLVGDEGIGKSLLWVWITAAVTTGTARPEFGIPARQPGRVCLILTEDDWSTTVRPRLEKAGAELANIDVICEESDGSGSPIFPRDMALVRQSGAALVVVDAFADTVPGALSLKDPQQARLALHPWKETATVMDNAVLLLTHTNRQDTRNARDKYGLTGELRKKARMTLFAQQDEDGCLTVGPEKANTTGAIAASRFTVDSVQAFTPTLDGDGTVGVLRYVGASEHTSSELIADNWERGRDGADEDDRTECENWLKSWIEDTDKTGGMLKAADVYKAMHAGGRDYSKPTVKRARRKLGLHVVTLGAGPGSETSWYLPDSCAYHDRCNHRADHAEDETEGVEEDKRGGHGLPPVSDMTPNEPHSDPPIEPPSGDQEGVTNLHRGVADPHCEAARSARPVRAGGEDPDRCPDCGLSLTRRRGTNQCGWRHKAAQKGTSSKAAS